MKYRNSIWFAFLFVIGMSSLGMAQEVAEYHYFMTVFAQEPTVYPKMAHTFANFAKVRVSEKGEPILEEKNDVSWLPASGVTRVSPACSARARY